MGGSSPQFILNAKRGRKYYFVVSRVKNSTLSSSYIAAHAYKMRNPRDQLDSGKNFGRHLKERKSRSSRHSHSSTTGIAGTHNSSSSASSCSQIIQSQSQSQLRSEHRQMQSSAVN